MPTTPLITDGEQGERYYSFGRKRSPAPALVACRRLTRSASSSLASRRNPALDMKSALDEVRREDPRLFAEWHTGAVRVAR